MRPAHERVPVILPPDPHDLRLGPHCQEGGGRAKLLRPRSSMDVLAYRTQGILSRPHGPGVCRPVDEERGRLEVAPNRPRCVVGPWPAGG